MTEEQRRFEQWAAEIYDTRLLKDEKGNYRGQVLQQLWQAWQAALIQPASLALKLPDEWSKRTDYEFDLGSESGWNACLAEVKRLNAPHTAPIEPICATGGADWVKCSDRMPNQGGWVLAWDGVSVETACVGVLGGWASEAYLHDVTHWMPLPAAPEA